MNTTVIVKTNSKIEWVDITARVQKEVSLAKIGDGLAIIYVPHTTAAITINEHADPAVLKDINQKLEELVPENSYYRHAEGNSDGHIKASLVGSSQTVIIENGKLKLGTWQGIFFCEFDGPRNRQVYIKTINS